MTTTRSSVAATVAAVLYASAAAAADSGTSADPVPAPVTRGADAVTAPPTRVAEADAGPATTRVADADSATATATRVADASTAADRGITEVVVTATRRAASSQDIPLSITAISGDSLEQSGIEDMADLAHSMAGISYTDKGPFGGVNGANLIIRGLNSETTSGLPAAASPVVPPVATYVDDTPLFFSLQLQDLERVEILRGPQGTLYGSGSLGGTIRFVQHAPDLSGFDAKVEATGSDTAHTHQPNEAVNAMLNVPLSDTFAVRVNGGWSRDAGFINQPNLFRMDSSGVPVAANPGDLFSPPVIYGKTGVNTYDYRSARVSALWKPNANFHAQLSYFYQLARADGFPYAATSTAAFNEPISPATQPSGTYANPALAAQLFNAPVPPGVDSLSDAEYGTTTTRDRVDLATLTLEYDFGFATLTSSTSWAHHVNDTIADETHQYINFFFFQSLYGQNPRTFVKGVEGLNDRPVTQELRLASRTGERFDWVTGLFYNHQQTDISEHDFLPGYLDFYNACQAIYGQSAGDGTVPSYCGVGETAYGIFDQVAGIPIVKDQAYIGDFETTFKDLAAYGELTWHLTDPLSVTGGARVFKQTVTVSQQTGLLYDGGPFFGPDAPIANLTLSNDWRKALWKVNVSYKLDAKNLVYATWSQGFRRGGVNALPATEPGIGYNTPPALTHLAPDTADNYEIGAKGTIGNWLKYSAAAFWIDWHNVQEGLQLTPLVLPASLNIGEATSKGFESELDALVTSHLEVQLDYTYDQTRLTELNPLFVQPNTSAPPPPLGSPLPGTPKSSVAIGLQYGQIPVGGGDLLFGVNAHYQSAELPALSATAPMVGGYTMLDARVSFSTSHWTATVFGTNLTNNLGITSYQDPAIFGNRAQAIVSQPRTIGLTVGYSYR